MRITIIRTIIEIFGCNVPYIYTYIWAFLLKDLFEK